MLDIRNATREDHQLLRKMYLSEVEDHKERANAFADDLIQRFKTLLAFCDGHLCGTASWDSRGGLDDGVIEMTSIGVNTSKRRQGVGAKLVESIIEDATTFFTQRGYSLRVIILFMERNNEVARKFYSSLGFKENASIEALYPSDDGSIWTRHL
ncbi:MAG: GNAT family N-acetyltransferase [Candidatus Thorarchaeota archaeon]